MAHDVTFSEHAARQLATIPADARAGLAVALDRIAADPEHGDRYGPQYPPDMRTTAFGDWGLIVYLIRPRARALSTDVRPDPRSRSLAVPKTAVTNPATSACRWTCSDLDMHWARVMWAETAGQREDGASPCLTWRSEALELQPSDP